MLVEVENHGLPFPCFTVNQAFSDTDCALLEAVFAGAEGWQRRDGAFYRCFLRDVTSEVSPEFCASLVSRMRDITRLPLANRVGVTAQRMAPGDSIGIHSDRPLLGFEVARLVVQMNGAWRSDHGGVLRLYDEERRVPVASVEPTYNRAFGFLLHETSHHSVDEVSRERRSVVFNFWHAGNTPALALAVRELFANAHFSDLPRCVHTMAERAEADLSEAVTLRAGLAALILHRWGVSESTLTQGYRLSVGWDTSAPPVARLADWLAHLHLESFDVEAWGHLRACLMGSDPVEGPARALARLCCPESGL
jgi:hypothetical protein